MARMPGDGCGLLDTSLAPFLVYHVLRPSYTGPPLGCSDSAVDSQSLIGATRLYERAGMHVAERYDTCEKVSRVSVSRVTCNTTPDT